MSCPPWRKNKHTAVRTKHYRDGCLVRGFATGGCSLRKRVSGGREIQLGVQGCGVSECGFQHTSLKPLTHTSFRCEVPILSVSEGQPTIILKSHILKHHIPQLPIQVKCASASSAVDGPTSLGREVWERAERVLNTPKGFLTRRSAAKPKYSEAPQAILEANPSTPKR